MRLQERRESFESIVDSDTMLLIEEETSMEIKKLQDEKGGDMSEAKNGDKNGRRSSMDKLETNDESPMPNSPIHSNHGNSNDGNDGNSSTNKEGEDSTKTKEGPDDFPNGPKNTKVSTRDVIKKLRHKCGAAVNNLWVQWTMILLIAINAIMIGIATFDVVKGDDSMTTAFEITDLVFLVIFTIELGMQFFYLGFRLFLDGWLVFDLLVISASWGSYSVDIAQLQILRAFRIFRTFRLITRVKIMRDLITALWSVMPRMGAIFLMLILIFYIFSVMFTQLYADVNYNFFGNLQNSALTLFQMMTMDGWSEITREIMETERTAWMFVISFVIITGFVMVNLMVAVVCDAISDLDERDKARIHGYESGSEGDSFRDVDLRHQLDMVEDQIGDLTRIQARTFHTLQYLTQHLRVQKSKRQDQTISNDRGSSSGSTKKRLPQRGRRASMPLMPLDRPKDKKNEPVLASKPRYKDERVTYTDTWTQQGSEMELRQQTVSNFAQMAKELNKLRETQGDVDSEELKKLRRTQGNLDWEELKLRGNQGHIDSDEPKKLRGTQGDLDSDEPKKLRGI
jgi:hypothetical protein